MININNISEVMYNQLLELISFVKINDIVDILIIAYFFYKIYIFAKDTRAGQVLSGTVILLILTKVSEILKLHSLYWITCNILTVGPIAILVIFQPELRALLERIGRSKFKLLVKASEQDSEFLKEIIDEICDATYYLAKNKIGALLIFERQTKLGDIINSGTILNSEISSQLLINIFTPNTPLHDGAVIIGDNIIKGASCFLPLSDQNNISKDLGTRHRAGIGVSEVSDCISLMVSEETGAVSISTNGILTRSVNENQLKEILFNELYTNSESQGINFFKKESEEK